MPAPDCVCELATKPPKAPASEVSRVMVRSRSPRPTASPRAPVCSIFEGWPTAPLGREGEVGVVGMVTAGVDAALAASVFHSGEIAIPDLKKRLRADGVEVRP